MSDVDLPLFRSKFLHACAQYLMSDLGIKDVIPFAKPRNELFVISPLLQREGPLPYYHRNLGGWGFDGSNDFDGGIMIDVRDSGSVTLRSPDGEFGYITTQIETPEDLGEIMALFETITEESIREPKWSKLPLSAIIEQVYLVLPGPNEDRLLPLDIKRLDVEQPELAKVLRIARDGWEKINSVEYYDWSRWVEKHADWTKLDDATTATRQDLYYADDCGLHSLWIYALRGTDYFDVSPKFAIRLNPRHSPMFFHLFAEQTREGAILDDLFKNLESWQQWLRKTHVRYPTGLDNQRRLVVEFRTLRQEYDDAHRSLVKEREPLEHLLDLFEKRAKYLHRFHKEYIHEMEAAQRPLPFFIEYPFHRWTSGDPGDRMERVLRAKHLLTIIVKAVALLPLEECLAHAECPDAIKAMAQEMGRKPFSDGGWVDFAGALRRAMKVAAFDIPVFGPLAAQSAEMEPRLKELVAARNRFNHPPYDVDGLIIAADKHFAELISMLRGSLGTCRLMVPLSLRANDGKRFVRASILSGRDTEPAVRELEVGAPLEQFPSGNIVAGDWNFRNVVPLKRFFTSRSFKTDTFDIGIFDRIEGETPQFEFVRGLGNQPQFDK